MCLNDLITFHENNKGIPNDVDKMFVIGLECRVDSSDFKKLKKDFEFIFQNLKKGMELVQPTKDFKPKYHIADNAYAICNGFLSGMFIVLNIYIMQIGVLEKRVNCWAHAIRLIDVQLYLIKDKEVRSCVRRDICCVQLSNSESIFNNVEWESSICSCFNWHKNLKCEHVISLATRLKLADFRTRQISEHFRTSIS